MTAINGMPDHLHMFIGMHPTDSMSGLIQVVKSESSKWINESALIKGKFKWQEGYGAFSYSRITKHIKIASGITADVSIKCAEKGIYKTKNHKLKHTFQRLN